MMTNLVQAIYGRDFPFATLSINVLCCFLGFLFIETLERLTISPVMVDLPLVIEFFDEPRIVEAVLTLLAGHVRAHTFVCDRGNADTIARSCHIRVLIHCRYLGSDAQNSHARVILRPPELLYAISRQAIVTTHIKSP